MTAAPKMFALLLALVVAFVAAGCGGGGDNNAAETETAAAETDTAAGGETKIDCRAPEFSGNPQLPKNFPMPGEFVVTSSTQEGPTRVVVGYWESGLDEAYNEWKDRVEEAGFNVTFHELEDHDSEVAYEGSGKTGIIQLKDRCNENEVTYVRITSRPE